MKRILLPTDFSDNSLKAIHYALKLFKNAKCKFYLMHTYMPPVYNMEYLVGSPGLIGLGDIMQETSMTQLEKLKSRLEKEYHNPDHNFVVHTAFNTLVNEVMETVESEGIHLVVMGTKGATGAEEILFGTNTVHVIRKVDCPVLVIPPNFEYENPLEILFPTDFEIEFSKERLAQLLEIADEHGSQINVLHVSTGYELTPEQERQKKGLEKILGPKALFHDVPNNEIINAINEFQAKEKINLLVMVQNKHTFMERLFIEPVIKKIGFHVTIPFMVIPQF
ncbi:MULTISPECIES: universal stress protein [unclassified Arenibacter]|jgi:nucleotide-binding universal stress UspA family protein|uniref:universal stress protein n=1 Tax=unclassified Arenibacter TaxID=2615047 RepID=UPI000E347830|nr:MULTISPECIES: universal stress protein [unclassified Arenibacter]MCM4163431.1 universal stress protein [Arenibacter sp. A80]RFT57429.1 universal stress protein [Arenibacter sp. P308M17]